MTTKVHAIFQHGVFLPSTPPPVADGTEVELIVSFGEEPNSMADALEEIARLPVEGSQDGFSGAAGKSAEQGTWAEVFREVIAKAEGLPDDSSVNHDHYLYGARRK
jgi:hypothetical protein